MIPLFSSAQVRAADNYAISKLEMPGEILMENAAISITEAIIEKYPYIDSSYKFGIVCGKGNNGGDGFALARHLLIRGFKVEIVSLAQHKDLKGDSLKNFNILKNLIIDYKDSSLSIFKSLRDLQKIIRCEIIVDSLLGTGSIGALREPYDKIIKKLNEVQSLKIAIDTPTGLNLENASGQTIFNANLTITLAALKTGLFYGEGRSYSGKVVGGSIGIGATYFNSLDTNEYLVEPEDVVNFLPVKKSNLHKYKAGKVLTVAGSSELPGAAIFAMNSAMISGAGAGILAFPKSLKTLAQSQMNSAVVLKFNDQNRGFLHSENYVELSEKISWADAVTIGPGLGRESETQIAIFEFLQKNPYKKFVIDADAINALKNKKYKSLDLTGTVFTPHHKEFSDLLGIDLKELELNLLRYGRKFSGDTGAFLVLKGAPTITFNPEGEVFINSTGNSGLAKFGSGDVLAGIIASFISQQKDLENSVIAAVYLHGLTADLILRNESEYGIIPQKLIEQFPSAVKFLRKSVV